MLAEKTRGLKTENYVISGLFSEGAFKKIFKAMEINSGQFFALKAFIDNEKGKSIKQLRHYDPSEKELLMTGEIARKHNTRHISAILRSFYSRELEAQVTVEEFFSAGSMAGFYPELKEGKPLPEKACLENAEQLFQAVQELKPFGFDYHGDIKFANVLVDAKEGKVTLKLTDFGNLGNSEKEKGLKGGLNWGYPATAAPELIASKEKPNPKTDLWSVGMMLYKMLSGEYLTGFEEPQGWVALPIMERISRFDIKVKQDTLKMGQEGIDAKIDALVERLENKSAAERMLKCTLRLNPEERKNPGILGMRK